MDPIEDGAPTARAAGCITSTLFPAYSRTITVNHLRDDAERDRNPPRGHSECLDITASEIVDRATTRIVTANGGLEAGDRYTPTCISLQTPYPTRPDHG